jgi:hypothetical protein
MKMNLCHMLGIEYPIIAAPMGPDLADELQLDFRAALAGSEAIRAEYLLVEFDPCL